MFGRVLLYVSYEFLGLSFRRLGVLVRGVGVGSLKREILFEYQKDRPGNLDTSERRGDKSTRRELSLSMSLETCTLKPSPPAKPWD
jgi:hypothetical protein